MTAPAQPARQPADPDGLPLALAISTHGALHLDPSPPSDHRLWSPGVAQLMNAVQRAGKAHLAEGHPTTR